MNAEATLLQRYLDGDMSAAEAEQFRARLVESPALRRELAELKRVGAALRVWSSAAEARAGHLLEPTLRRAQQQQRKRARHSALCCVLGGLLLVALPWARHGGSAALAPNLRSLGAPLGAAIERVEATDQQAQVFVVGSSSTPVVWLADAAQEDDEAAEQDPG